jgi:hypothetical protein
MYANDDILLIDKELIFKYTQLGGNVDVDKIYPFVKIAQDIQVQELLGTKLYRYILTQVENGYIDGQLSNFGFALCTTDVDSLRHGRFVVVSWL